MSVLKKYLKQFFVLALISLLIIAFVSWGIGNVLIGGQQNEVASVGEQSISTEQFQRIYKRQLQDYSTRFQQELTPEQAQLLGIPKSTLNNLITLATLDEITRKLGLTISDKIIAEQIHNDKFFFGSQNKFDRPTFERILRLNNLTEASFFQEIRYNLVRNQLLNAIVGTNVIPDILTTEIYQYFQQRRNIRYITLQPSGNYIKIKSPTKKNLKEFYKNTKTSFSTAEKRNVDILTITTEQLTKNIKIDNASIKNSYEEHLETYKIPEIREIDQMAIKDEHLNKVKKLLAKKTSFAKIRETLKLTPEDTYLGALKQKDFLSKAIAQHAFSLKQGETSQIINTEFGAILLHIRHITLGKTQSLEDVKNEIRNYLVLERAYENMLKIATVVDNKISEGLSFEVIANNNNIQHTTLKSVKHKDTPTLSSKLPNLMNDIYTQSIGSTPSAIEQVENEEIKGYYWIRVNSIIPKKIQPFDVVKNKVKTQWEEKERITALTTFAKTLTTRANQNKSIKNIAKELNKKPLQKKNISRQTNDDTFSSAAIQKVFQSSIDEYSWHRTAIGNSIVIVAPYKLNIAPADPIQREEFGRIQQEQFDTSLLLQLITGLQNEYGVKTNETVLESLLGNIGNAP